MFGGAPCFPKHHLQVSPAARQSKSSRLRLKDVRACGPFRVEDTCCWDRLPFSFAAQGLLHAGFAVNSEPYTPAISRIIQINNQDSKTSPQVLTSHVPA